MKVNNLNQGKKFIINTLTKSFGTRFEGIKGDVNWTNGEIQDGRPNLRRNKYDLPKRKYGKPELISSDFSEALKELKSNPIYLTYNRRKRGLGKFEDIVMEKK
jgi:hypothetical protein